MSERCCRSPCIDRTPQFGRRAVRGDFSYEAFPWFFLAACNSANASGKSGFSCCRRWLSLHRFRSDSATSPRDGLSSLLILFFYVKLPTSRSTSERMVSAVIHSYSSQSARSDSPFCRIIRWFDHPGITQSGSDRCCACMIMFIRWTSEPGSPNR